MKALLYHGPANKAWDEVPQPTIVDETDAIVQVDATTICGTDLHILKGDVPAVTAGRILGHEAVGTGPRHQRRRQDAGRGRLRPRVLRERVWRMPGLSRRPLRPVHRRRSSEDAEAVVAELTGGLGADVAIEAVGIPATFEQAVRLARPGGHVANIGVHGTPATLHLEDIWSRDLIITTGLIDTNTTPTPHLPTICDGEDEVTCDLA